MIASQPQPSSRFPFPGSNYRRHQRVRPHFHRNRVASVFAAAILALMGCFAALSMRAAGQEVQKSPTSIGAVSNSTSLNGPGNVFLAAQALNAGIQIPAIAVADFNGDGKPDIALPAPCSGCGVGIYLGKGDGTFQPGVSTVNLGAPSFVTTGDFNGDGKQDLVVIGGLPTNQAVTALFILLGNGDGTFTLKSTNTGLTNQGSAVVGDFNGDGKLDVAVTDRTSTGDAVLLFLGNGDGTLQAPTSVNLGSNAFVNQIVAADFNKDGHLDLAVSFRNQPAVDVILGNGNGTFQAPRVFALPTTNGGYGVAVGDFNGDGVPDLVATTPNIGGVSVFLGKGDGNFTPVNNPVSGTLPTTNAAVPNGGASSVAVGDFNKDGKLDVIVGLSGVNGAASVAVLLGNGDGTLQPQQLFGTTDFPSFVAVADFNGDGNLDWVTNGNQILSVAVALGRGDGTFLAARNFVAGNGPQQAAVADFNKDGTLDVAVANLSSNDTSILIGNGDGTFQLPVSLSIAGTVPVGLVTGDFNGDGNPDVIVLNGPGGFVGPCLGTQLNCLSVFLGKGDGTFQAPTVISTGSGAVAGIIAGDFNGDGKLDLAFLGGGTGSPVSLGILLGNGDGTFKVLTPFSPGGIRPGGFSAADLNKDGKLDLVVSDVQSPGGTQSQLQILLGNGDGTFQAPTNLTSGHFTGTLLIADFNGDGNLDIVAANELDSNAEIWLGNGNGTFNSPTLLNTGGASGVLPRGMLAGDFNLDGHLDIAFTHGSNADPAGHPHGVGLLLGNGDGTFQAPQEYLVSRNAIVQAAADFNRDGTPDILLLDSNQNFLTVLLNQTPPPIAVSPSSLSFGNQLVGTTSSALMIKVSNNGSTATTIGVSASGDFAQTNNCPVGPATLAPAASCNISVTFKPTATGPRSGAVAVTDTLPGSPQMVSLSGTGVAPVVTLGAANVSFGNQIVGSSSSPQVVGLQNTGTATLTLTGAGITITGTNSGDFSQTNNCGASVAVGANCSINITFKPTATGSRSASLSINDDASGSPQSVPLSGTGLAPAVSLSGTSLSFGNQPVGTSSAAQNVTLTNSGNAALTISSIAVAGANSGDFSQTNTCPASPATLTAGANCMISVTFTPTATGARAASVSITDNASGSPQSVSLSGTGAAAAPMVTLLPTSLSFGNQRVGTSSASQNVTLTNTGNATLTLSIAITGANSGDFSQTNTCGASVAAGANCSISVTFKPTATGARAASVTVTDNASGSPQNVPLSGTGTAPAVMLSATSLNFGGQLVTTASAAQNVTVTNNGTATLNITTIAVGGTNSGDFSQTNTCGATLAAAASCSISVTFKPTATGNRAGNVAITDDASGSPQTVTLTGTGTDFSIDAASGGSTTASVTAGQPATYKLQVTPISGFNGTVNLTCSGAPSEAVCSVSPASATPTGGNAFAFTATVTTTAPTMMLPRTAPPNWPPFVGMRLMFLLLTALVLRALLARSRDAVVAQKRPLGLVAVLGLVLVVLAWAGACTGGGGGGIHDPGTPKGASTLTVTGTSGSVTRTQNLTLTVN